MRTKKAALLSVVAAAAVGTVAAVSGVASATPGSGIASAPVVARGSFVDPVDVKFKLGGDRGTQVVDVKDAAQTVVQQVKLDVGGHSGWHTHHGPVIVVVQSGAVTLLEAHRGTCQRTRYVAGQSFVDPGQGAHIARNTGSSPAELWATYLDVPPGASPRVDAADPGVCG